MREANSSRGLIRFGVFEVDIPAQELRKHGLKLKIQDQPFRILTAMLERPGEIFSREELARLLWPEGTFVDFDHGLNAAVAKLRQALHDSAETPRYVETVARRGYRFLAPVEIASQRNSHSVLAPPEPIAVPPERKRTNRARPWWFAIGGLVLILTAVPLWLVTAKPETKLEQITRDPGLSTEPVLSPDGRLLAYSSDRNGGQNLNIWVTQRVAGGKSMQLTHDTSDAHQPSFSPDGSRIVYRSEREGGGIYVIPAIGGEPVLLATGGRDPRFSPDGKSIAFWMGAVAGSAPEADASGSVFVMPAAGGEAKQIGLDMPPAGLPIWSADSKQLLVYANPRASVLAADADWWTVPLGGGPAQKTNIFSVLKSQGLSLQFPSRLPRASSWVDDTLTFSAQLGDGRNIWEIPFRASEGRASGKAVRLTQGTTVEVHPSSNGQGSFVFASLNQTLAIWTIPVNGNNGVVTGELRKVTEGTASEIAPTLSADGQKLAFGTNVPNQEDIWIKDLQTGKETPIANTASAERFPMISRDGSMIAYTVGYPGEHSIYIVPSTGGRPTLVGAVLARIWDWTPGNQQLLIHPKGPDPAVKKLDVRSRAMSDFVVREGAGLFQAKFSPDGKWLVFEAVFTSSDNSLGDSRVFIAKIDNGSVNSAKEWILAGDEHGWADKPRWSPDGNSVYFVSHRDGFRCIWAQQLDPATKHPAAEPFPVYHFHKSRLSPMNVGLGLLEMDVAQDKIVVNLGELTGNIWGLSRR
jgi:Tol biopolymer transport system component/DNA-binding winged helix-turn-helix (wHTH) protein